MEFNIKTMAPICEICGKNRAIKNIHARCSKIRQQRRVAAEKKAKVAA